MTRDFFSGEKLACWKETDVSYQNLQMNEYFKALRKSQTKGNLKSTYFLVSVDGWSLNEDANSRLSNDIKEPYFSARAKSSAASRDFRSRRASFAVSPNKLFISS